MNELLSSYVVFGVLFLFGITAAKWTLDLGHSQFRQILAFIAGFLFGPLMLANLYLHLVRAKTKQHEAGSQYFGSKA